MKPIPFFALLKRRVLVRRDSARSVKPVVAKALSDGSGEIEFDLAGVAALTPSFFDETLSIVEECASETSNGYFKVTLKSPPTSPSLRSPAMARRHQVTIEELDNGDFVITSLT